MTDWWWTFYCTIGGVTVVLAVMSFRQFLEKRGKGLSIVRSSEKGVLEDFVLSQKGQRGELSAEYNFELCRVAFALHEITAGAREIEKGLCIALNCREIDDSALPAFYFEGESLPLCRYHRGFATHCLREHSFPSVEVIEPVVN